MKYFLLSFSLMILYSGCSSSKTITIPSKASSNWEKYVENDIFLKIDSKGHTGKINDIIVTDSKDIITASSDKTIRVWDSKTGKEKRKILGKNGNNHGTIYAIALSPNEEFLIVGGFFKSPNDVIRVYNYKSGELIKILKSHKNTITDLSFSHDGKYFISASVDKTAKIWRTRGFLLQDTINLHSNYVYAVKIIKNNNKYFAVTAGFDNQIILYDMEEKKLVKSYNLKYKLQYLAVSKNEISVCGDGNKIQVFDYTLKPIQTISLKTNPSGLAYSLNGDFLVSGFSTKFTNHTNINIFDVKNNYKLINSFRKHENTTIAVAFLDNETVVSGGGNSQEIYIWDKKTGNIRKKIVGVGNTVWAVGIHNNVVSWGNIVNPIHINRRGKLDKGLDLKTLKIVNIKNKSFKIFSSQKMDYSLVEQENGTLLLLKKGQQILSKIRLNAENGIQHNCYGFYKNYIVSGGSNGFLRIYNLDGSLVAKLIGHTGTIWSIALDGDRLVSGGSDQTIRIWDLSRLNNTMINNDILRILKEEEEKKYGKNFTFQEYRKKFKITQIIDIIYPQLNLFFSDNNEWITWTPKGYFNTSNKGIEYLNFHLNNGGEKEAKIILMRNLYDTFNRPDLIKLKLTGHKETFIKASKGITYKTALQNPPPTIKIKQIDTKIKKNKIKLSFNIKDNNGGIGLIRIYQEGKLIQTIGDGKVNKQSANIDTILEQEEDDKKNKKNQTDEKMNELLAKAKNGTLDINDTIANQKIITTINQAGEYEIELELISGKNEIGIEAFNKTNTVTSYRETIVIDADIPKKKAKLYAIVVGIDNFKSKPKKYHLNYAEKDALSIQKEIENKIGKTFDEVEVKSLIGQDVTRANILKSAKEIAQKAKLEDTIIFYISTHGRAVKGNLYFAPYNNAQGRDWIDFQQTFKAIQYIKALNQIFIVDACESGQANEIVSAVYDSRASILARSAGVHMLLATTKGAYAFEPKDKSKNVMTFTQRILKTLRDKESDKDGDGFVSVVELSKSLKEAKNIVEYQYPVIRNVGGDVRLRRVD